MAGVTEALRRGVRASRPEVARIGDAGLRERVVEAWAPALAGSEVARIEALPASGNPGTPPLTRGTQADHIRGVARLALAVADTLEARLGPLGVDRDLLLAAALCHDVGKPYEVSPRNQARWRADPRPAGHPAPRHPLYGAHLALTVGLPEAVARVAGAHSPEGQCVTRSPVCTIAHRADEAFWEIARGAGLLQPQPAP